MNKKQPVVTPPVVNLERYEEFKVKISQLVPFDLNFGNMTLTEYELLVMTIYRLNELISIVNMYSTTIDEVLEWIIGDGLQESVLNQLNVWLADGTLEVLVNETLFNTKLDKIDFEEYKLLANQNLEDLEENIQTIINEKISNLDNEKAKQLTFHNNYVQYFAHRGAEAHTPENTVKAFELANTIGYDGFELDIWFSTDGVPFVFHDDNVDRMTNGTGRADSKSILEIQTLNIDGGNFVTWNKGLKIPLLEDVLLYAKRVNKPVLVEVKGYNGDSNNLVTLHNMIISNGLQGLVTVLGHYGIVDSLSQINSKLKTMIFHVDDAGFNSALEHTNVVGVSFDYTQITQSLVNEIHAKGKLVTVWTVIDRVTANEMSDLGVDIIVGSVRK